MPNTSASTLHMGENETMSASVNKDTIEDSGWYIVNTQRMNTSCIYHYKSKGDFINFRLSWSDEKSNHKPQHLAVGGVTSG